MKRVLVVDDERKMRRLLQMMLENLGLESVPSESGEEALVLAQAEHFDLVMTDLRLPGMVSTATCPHSGHLISETSSTGALMA